MRIGKKGSEDPIPPCYDASLGGTISPAVFTVGVGNPSRGSTQYTESVMWCVPFLWSVRGAGCTLSRGGGGGPRAPGPGAAPRPRPAAPRLPPTPPAQTQLQSPLAAQSDSFV